MINFLKRPLLPEKKVKCVAVSGENTKIISALESLDIDVYIIQPNLMLDKSIACHADCMIVQLDSQTTIVDESQFRNFAEYSKKYINNLEVYSDNIVNIFTNGAGEEKVNLTGTSNSNSPMIFCSSETVHCPYPYDVYLNVKIVGKKILCNKKYISESIVTFAETNGFELIHCNQGYAGCSSVVISDNAILTDDPSIYFTSVSNGFDAIKLSTGQIKLNGYDYGFIGGCCGMIDKNLLAFTGAVEKHRDYKSIKAFLDKYNVSYINLTNEELIDVGGIIPLFE